MLWARRAADAGNAVGEYIVGVLFERGWGVPQDKRAAASWFARAAEHGHKPAVAALRSLALEGVPEALPTLRLLAEVGDVDAQLSISYLYTIGKGVARDYTAALLWARRAADAGNAIGEFNVGVLFDNGLGVPQDKRAAASWFARAAERGHEPATAALRALASKGVAEAAAAIELLF